MILDEQTLSPQPREPDDDRLTRAEASEYLKRFHIQMKPATLARVWSAELDLLHPRGPSAPSRQAARRRTPTSAGQLALDFEDRP